jgi:hypothetical protein
MAGRSVHDKFDRKWKEAVLVQLHLLSRYFHEGTEEIHEKSVIIAGLGAEV